MKHKEYDYTLIAQANTFSQYSGDGWENVTRTLIITPQTTVEEIIKWHQSCVIDRPEDPFCGIIHITTAETPKVMPEKHNAHE